MQLVGATQKLGAILFSGVCLSIHGGLDSVEPASWGIGTEKVYRVSELTAIDSLMNVLVVDDESSIRQTTSVVLDNLGHRAFTAMNTRQADKLLRNEPIDAMFLDIKLDGENGLDFLTQLKEEKRELPPIVVFTAYSSVETAVEAIKRGAVDYIQKPFIPDDIKQLLNNIESKYRMRSRIEELESQIAENNPVINLESNEPCVQRALEIAFKSAKSEVNILILGPSGTGKTVLARNVHQRSNRADKNFVTVNCPSLSKELLESELFGHVKGAFTGAVQETWGKVAAADGGTLFLDEIGELPLEIQPKFLRLLQDLEYERVGETRTRKANIRLIAATNRDLEEEVRKGNFREDLYYRLKVITVSMPALCERPKDIIPIAQNYLDFFGRREGRSGLSFSSETERALFNYPWPGNLREMRNVVERALILTTSNVIEIADLPLDFQKTTDSAVRVGQLISLKKLEEEHIKRVVSQSSNMVEAAKILEIDVATLYRKRKKLDFAIASSSS